MMMRAPKNSDNTLRELGRVMESLFIWTIVAQLLGILFFPLYIVLFIKIIQYILRLRDAARTNDSPYLKKTYIFYLSSILSYFGIILIISMIASPVMMDAIEGIDPNDIDLLEAAINTVMDQYIPYFILGTIIPELFEIIGYYYFYKFSQDLLVSNQQGRYNININKGLKFLLSASIVSLGFIFVDYTFNTLGIDSTFYTILSLVPLGLELAGLKIAGSGLKNQYSFGAPTATYYRPTQMNSQVQTNIQNDPYFQEQPAATIRCPVCGKSVRSDEVFCKYCGFRIIE